MRAHLIHDLDDVQEKPLKVHLITELVEGKHHHLSVQVILSAEEQGLLPFQILQILRRTQRRGP